MPIVSRPGVEVFYETEGSGPALVLHTGAGGDSRIWRYAGYLAELAGFRAILIDQRGRGRSGRPTDVGSHRLGDFIEDVAAVLDDVGAPTAAFWGYSNGVLVGIGLAGAHPDRVRCVIGTGGIRYRDLTEIPRGDPAKEIANDVAHGGVQAELEERMRVESDAFPPEIDRNVREGDPLMHALDGVAWLDWAGPKSVLDSLRTPFLMLTGEKEDPTGATEETIRHVAHGRVVRLPGVGHLGAFYRSDLALPIALPFLREHSPPE